MKRTELAVAGTSLALCLSMSACTRGPEPSYIAPVAIATDDGVAIIAFCEDIDLADIGLSQELSGKDSGFETLFDGAIAQEFRAGETLRLDGDIAALDPDNRLAEFTTTPGTTYIVSASTPRGGGFVGVIDNVPDDWAEGQWLPTESVPSADPCDFWDGLNN